MGCGSSTELHPLNTDQNRQPGYSQNFPNHPQAQIMNSHAQNQRQQSNAMNMNSNHNNSREPRKDDERKAKESPAKRAGNVEVTRSAAKLQMMLKEFEDQHNKIQSRERTKCFEHNRVILEELELYSNRKLRANQLYSDCLQRINNFTNENGLSPDITLREVVANRWIQKTDLTDDDSELIKLLSTREIMDISREKIAWNMDTLNSAADNYKILCEELQDCYEKRDDILTTIFGPTYRSEQELKLDRELEALLEERHFMECAKLRWLKASQFLRDAMLNLHSAIDTLEKYENCLENDIDNRFTLIREARNDLHSYTFNIKSVKCILLNLSLPHIKTDDHHRLKSIIDGIFTQTFTNEPVQETVTYLSELLRHTNTQNKWVKEVLIGTIQRDLKLMRTRCESKCQELFLLRCFHIERLIKEASSTKAGQRDDTSIDKNKDKNSDMRTANSEGNSGGTAPKTFANAIKYFHDSPLELRGEF